AKSAFEARTIKMMELLVLSTLKWRMQAVIACSFIDYFLCKFNDNDTPSMFAFSRSTDLIVSTTKCMKVKSDPLFSIHRPMC
uniref:Cyclin N-terminal domain-containing protein n=1 Tax=Aegilops tauschii subsp. strangulata TaxID=200361 RepID=A0A453FRC8_AEGTS